MSRIAAFALLAAIFMGYKHCHATEWPQRWSVNVGAISHHSQPGLNEQHPGLGIEARWDDIWAATAGQLRNSQGNPSHYVAAIYTPWAPALPVIGQIHVGALAGAIDGYRINNGGPIPLIAGAIEKRWQWASMALVLIPAVPKVSSSAVVLMLKLEVPDGLL